MPKSNTPVSNPTLDALLVRLRPHFEASDILTELTQLLPYESGVTAKYRKQSN